MVNHHGSQRDRVSTRQRLNRVASGADQYSLPMKDREMVMVMLIHDGVGN